MHCGSEKKGELEAGEANKQRVAASNTGRGRGRGAGHTCVGGRGHGSTRSARGSGRLRGGRGRKFITSVVVASGANDDNGRVDDESDEHTMLHEGGDHMLDDEAPELTSLLNPIYWTTSATTWDRPAFR